MRQHSAVAALLALLLLVGASCNNDDEGAGEASDEVASTEATSPAVPCDGEPVTFAVVGSLSGPLVFNDVPGAEAAVQEANRTCEAGRPIELFTCDDRGDPNAAADCARQGVDEGAVAAFVFSAVEDDADAILDQEGIPFITSGNTAAGVTSPVSFPIVGAVPVFFAGPSIAAATGAESFGVVAIDTPAAAGVAEAAEARAAAEGVDVGRRVLIPPDATDLAQYAAQAEENGALALALTGDLAERFLGALVDQGTDLEETPVVAAAVLTQEAVDEFDGAVDGLYIASQGWSVFDEENEGVAQYVQELHAADPDAEVEDPGLLTWSGVHVVAEAAKSLEQVTPESLAAALEGLEVNRPEIAPLTYGEPAFPDDPVFGDLRIFSHYIGVFQVVDGKIEPVSDTFLDLNVPFDLEGS